MGNSHSWQELAKVAESGAKLLEAFRYAKDVFSSVAEAELVEGQLKQRIEDLQERIKVDRETIDSLGAEAHRKADGIIKAAEANAVSIEEAAREKAASIVAEASNTLNDLNTQIEKVKSSRRLYEEDAEKARVDAVSSRKAHNAEMKKLSEEKSAIEEATKVATEQLAAVREQIKSLKDSLGRADADW